MNKLLILQWGKHRSIVQDVTRPNEPVIIMDNQYLMNLDEQGIIIND